jgi:hypothetical protein
LVSKPVRAPFSDGSNVLVRELVAHLPAARPLSYFGDPGAPVRAGADDDVITAAPMGHAPSAFAKLRVLSTLLHRRRRQQPLHFFFTPNRATSTVVALLRQAQPRRAMIQTLMSSDRVEAWASLLAPLDLVVVLSDHTAAALARAGLPAERVRRIHPGVPAAPGLADPARSRRLLYAGDLDARVAERLCAIGAALGIPALAGWQLVVACRPKGDADAAARARIERDLAGPLAAGRVELAGEVPDLSALMRGCAAQLFVADHVRRKVDLPLAVLEGLSWGLGLIAVDFAPVSEIFERAAEHGLCPGTRVAGDPAGLAQAVARAAADPALLLRWSRDARELASRAFSVERMAGDYAELYAQLDPAHGSER